MTALRHIVVKFHDNFYKVTVEHLFNSRQKSETWDKFKSVVMAVH
jgi:hypothetical protein